MGTGLEIAMWAMFAASTVYSYEQARKAKNRANASAEAAKGFEFSVEGEAFPVPVAYGRNMLGGIRAYHNVSPNYVHAALTGSKYALTVTTPAVSEEIAEYVNQELTARTVATPSFTALSSNTNGQKNEFLYVQQVISHGPINQVWTADVDDKPFDHADYRHGQRINLDNAGGAADPMITANFAARSSSLFTHTATASMAFRLNRDNPQYGGGVPNVQFYFEGIKVSTITRSGSPGSYVYATGAATYSNNPVRCLLDYLTNAVYGRGLALISIDLESFYNAMEVCDTTVRTGVTTGGKLWAAMGVTARNLPLYECNIILDSDKPIRSNVEEILSTMGDADLVWSGGVYKLQLQYPTSLGAIVVAGPIITDSDIVRDSISISFPSASDRKNYCTVQFRNEAQDFKNDSVSWPPKYSSAHSALLATDGGIPLEMSVTLNGTVDRYHALAKAEELVRGSRSAVSYSFKLHLGGIAYEPGDIVRVNSSVANIIDEYIKIKEIKFNEDNTASIKGSKFDFTVLAWNVSDNEIVTGRNNYSFTMTPATNVIFVPNGSALLGYSAGTLTWVAPTGAYVKEYIVQTASNKVILAGMLQWREIGRTSMTTLDLAGLAAGQYVFRVLASSMQDRTVTSVISPIYTMTSTYLPWDQINGANRPANGATVGKSLGKPLSAWVLAGQLPATITDGKVGNEVLRLFSTGGYPNQGSFVAIDRSKKYRVRFWARPAGAANGILYFSLRQFTDSIGTPGPVNNGRSPYKPSGQSRASHNTQFAVVDQWGEYSYIWDEVDWQAGATYVMPEFLNNYQGTTGWWEIQDFSFEEVTEVFAAQTAAGNAQIAANAANAALTNIASDSILSPSEKPSVVQDFNVITNEQAGIVVQANTYSLSVTAYNGAITTLTNYLGGLTGWNTVPGGDVVIVGSTFRGNFAAVYTEKQALLNAIASEAGKRATWGGVGEKPADTDLLNTHTQGNVLVINHPGGGNFADNRDNLPGAIKIRLPVTWTNTMIRFFVEVYEYETNRSFTVEVGGYTSGNGAWIKVYAKMTGSAAAEKKIYFGHDDTKCCIWIGEPASTWRYPQVTVTNFRAGYSGHVEANWKTGWQVSLDTSLATTHAITGTVTSPLTGASWSEIPAGTGKAADNATANQSDATTNNAIGVAGTTAQWSNIVGQTDAPANNATANQPDATTNNSIAGAQANAISTASSDAQAKATAAQTAAINSSNAGLAQRLRNDSRNVLNGAAGLAAGTLNWDSAGAYSGGYGVAVTSNGLVAYSAEFGNTPTFALGANGDLTLRGTVYAAAGEFAGTVQVGTSPTVNGSTMTGVGAVFNPSGTFAIGNSTKNISFSGGDFTLNGTLISTGNVYGGAVVDAGLAESTVGVGGQIGPASYLVCGVTVYTPRSNGKMLISATWTPLNTSGCYVGLYLNGDVLRNRVYTGNANSVFHVQDVVTGIGAGNSVVELRYYGSGGVAAGAVLSALIVK